MAVELHTLLRSHVGGRCFFLGNGPSVNTQDLSLLAHEVVWAANRAYLLFDRISWRPSFYVVKDPRVIEYSADALNASMRGLPDTTFFYPDWVRSLRKIEEHQNVCFFRESATTSTMHPRFSFNAAEGIVRSKTVATVVMQLAAWMGFDPIVLIGCDMSYAMQGRAGGQAECCVNGATDPDHFDPRYLADGSWEVPDVDGMLIELAAARAACDAQGITVLNATAGGELAAFPRVAYENVLRRA